MSGSASLTLEQGILQHTLGIAAMAFPSRVYVALCAAGLPPSESIPGVEAFGGSYARVAATFALLASPTNIAANTASVEFPLATAGWGSLGYFEIWTAQTGGLRLYWGGLVDPVSGEPTTLDVSAGDIIRFSAGTLAVEVAAPTVVEASGVSSFNTRTGDVILSNSDVVAVLPPSANAPLANGTAAVGTSAAWARGDHVHPDGNLVSVLSHGARGDGTTDDTAAIQSVLNTYAGEAIVFIPDTGLPYMVSPLLPPTGTDLLIHGTLKLRPASANGVIYVINANNVTIRGHGVLDGNGPAQTGSLIASLMSFQANNLRVSGITITNALNWPLDIRRSSNVVVSGCTISKGGSANQFTEVSDDCWLMNCTVDGTGNGDYAFAFYGGVTNSGAIGNIVKNAGVGTAGIPPGIGVLSDGGDGGPNGFPCRDIIIANNICYNNRGAGVSCINVASSPSSVQTGITISGNRCHNNNQSFNATIVNADIYIDNTVGIAVTGNQLSANGTGTHQFVGMFLGPGASHVSVVGNQIFNVGASAASSYGIQLQNANDVLVEANHIYDSQSTQTLFSGIAGTAGLRNAFIGNLIGTLASEGITAALSGDTVLSSPTSPTRPLMTMAPNGVGAPTFSARSAGTKFVLYPSLTSVATDYAFGVAPATLWFGVPNTSDGFSWYSGITQTATLDGAGNFVTTGGITSNGTALVSGNNVFQVGTGGNAIRLTPAPAGTDATIFAIGTGNVNLQVGGQGTGSVIFQSHIMLLPTPINAANDAAAASAGVPLAGMYRNGSVLMVRIA